MLENLPEEMKGLQSILDQAKVLDEPVYRELRKSQLLLENGFYTESALRLGRAVEASIYSTARLLGMSVSAVGVKQIGDIANRLNGVQISIAQGESQKGIQKILACIKDLADEVSQLTVPTRKNNFSEEKTPLPIQQLYGAFKDHIKNLESNENFDKTAIQSRLGQEQSQVKDLFFVRNKAAHASLDGNEREVSYEDYQKLVSKVSTVISTLFDIRLILQSLEK
ncbi:MAG: hypothetical protein WCP16_04845 [Pseudanabaena sp. ELA645]|jgi:hypothetical protein